MLGTVIIEEGLSYGIYTQTVEPDAKPIVIQPDGDITINYLDTKGLPLTPDHLSSAIFMPQPLCHGWNVHARLDAACCKQVSQVMVSQVKKPQLLAGVF